jgi:hypothetical protein
MTSLTFHLYGAARRLALLAGVLLLAGAAVTGVARADDDDEEAPDVGFIRGLLGGGNKDGIDYRERSPLVIPPSAEMPPPDAGSTDRAAAWPQDPDVKRRQKGAGGARKPAVDSVERGGRALRPDELRRGATASSGPRERSVTLSDTDIGRPLMPSELGTNTSLFGMFAGGNSDKPESFTSEPTRSRLTEPPVGYRTPSSTQPYAPPRDSTSWFKIPNWFDRGISKDQ